MHKLYIFLECLAAFKMDSYKAHNKLINTFTILIIILSKTKYSSLFLCK